MHLQRNPEVYLIPEQAYVIVPMIGDGRTPLAIGSNLDQIELVCNEMNSSLGSDMFIVECMFHMPFGGERDVFDITNYSIYRDADNMDWVKE